MSLSSPRLLCALLVLALSLSRVLAHGGEEGSAVGFDEKLGAFADLDASFTGEDGKPVTLASLSGKPMILAIAYYRCKDQCNTLYTGMARALRDLKGVAGKDWQVVAVSINPEETPVDARDKKRIALATIERPFPEAGWRFLVGDHEAIDRLTTSVGFEYRKEGEDFAHPLGIIMLSPEGKVVRYLIGPDFLPVDLSMSIMEASAGIVTPTVAKMLRLCLTYDPQKKQFGFNYLRVIGIFTTIVVVGIAIALALSGNRRRLSRIDGPPPAKDKTGGAEAADSNQTEGSA